MSQKRKRRFKNRLAIVRRRNLMSQKQVSGLLGNRSNDQISRYERGIQLPSLRNALKLALIYDIPVRVLLDRYFEECRNEVAREQTGPLTELPGKNRDPEFCTFERSLRWKKLNQGDHDKIRGHVTTLINKQADILGHR